MNRFLASNAKALLAATALTVTVPAANAMPYLSPQLAASSQLILVDHDDDDRRSSGRYRGGDDGWSWFRGDPRDNDNDDDDDDDDDDD
ncbi:MULTISPECIES: hypothetical protein [unclassified Rhizobium]|uniref:hypothetical protein n=1 Tax=unclassified Rhizobium TaxID=2613769 RepID=UPI001780D941|nr:MULTISPECIES: hypothetical protein [unclassified Rhizobium]MBD8688872.1 hypothetical protein [Rhizobium sp. CFBP 13644]MBD8694157.1 hypothetical protein [Rhizobium sp. CFBP 13717]